MGKGRTEGASSPQESATRQVVAAMDLAWYETRVFSRRFESDIWLLSTFLPPIVTIHPVFRFTTYPKHPQDPSYLPHQPHRPLRVYPNQ